MRVNCQGGGEGFKDPLASIVLSDLLIFNFFLKEDNFKNKITLEVYLQVPLRFFFACKDALPEGWSLDIGQKKRNWRDKRVTSP